jgi:hypothetical protein
MAIGMPPMAVTSDSAAAAAAGGSIPIRPSQALRRTRFSHAPTAARAGWRAGGEIIAQRRAMPREKRAIACC